MSRLTLTEKEHWKQRIERRVDKAIADLEAQDPTLTTSIRTRAKELAHECLGTLAAHQKTEALQLQIKSLEENRDQTERAMLPHALGDEGMRRGEYYARNDFAELHRKRMTRFEDQLLQESPLGAEIMSLRAERDALLDTVWLATSPTHIRDLWSRVSQVLGEESTPLQQQILTADEHARS